MKNNSQFQNFILRKSRLFLFISLALIATAASSILPITTQDANARGFRSKGEVVTADRASGTLTVIDVRTDTVSQTVVMPDNGEPMYLAHSPYFNERLFVADRANDRIVVFDPDDYTVEAFVPAGDGPFHCWIDDWERQLWLTNDIDNTATVVDIDSLNVIATVSMPTDLLEKGYQIHDVNIANGWWDDSVFLTMIAPEQPGYVLRYSSNTFQETARRELGGDPHVSLRLRWDAVYVMSQDADTVYTLDRWYLTDLEEPLDVPGAHGADMSRSGFGKRFLFTTNLPGGGTDGLVVINTLRNEVTNQVDTPFPVPHNITTTPDGRKLYVTHSGATANQTTVWRFNLFTGQLNYLTTITTGFNPFGLAYVD